MKTFIVLFAILAVATCDFIPIDSAPDFDVNKFVGHWYSIGAIVDDQKVLDACHCLQSNFTLNSDGSINLYVAFKSDTNSNFTILPVNGTMMTTDNKSKFILKVGNIPIETNVWILKVDSNYTTVLMGSPSRTYLEIVSRKPLLDDTTYHSLVDFAQQEEYPVDQISRISQDCGSFI